MLTIVQSNKVEKLFEHLLAAYRHPDNKASVFEPFNVIVPSKVMGEWLKKQVADQAGISTLVTTEFWGKYLLSLMQKVLRTYARFREDVLTVPEVAMLSKSVMQWQIFGLLLSQQQSIVADKTHPMHPFLATLIPNETQDGNKAGKGQATPPSDTVSWANNRSQLATNQASHHASHQSQEQRLWQLANDMATMLNRYMTYRPNWLAQWGKGEPIAVANLVAERDALHNRLHGRQGEAAVVSPDWLIEHYVQLEVAQRWLWQTLFDDDYRYRQRLEAQFWQAFDDPNPRAAKACRERLPKQLLLFTVQQLPPTELLDLQRLGSLTDVTLLHFNPSQQFWADIVDKNWLVQQQISHPESVTFRDYGHTLLSRFGKQSREVFAMLANLSGNDDGTVYWVDDFVDSVDGGGTAQPSLLGQIQQDILMLEEQPTQQKIQAMLTLARPSADSQATVKDELQQQLKRMQQAGLKAGLHNAGALQRILERLDREQQHQPTARTRAWQLSQLIDTSLSIHACHSMVRQLEVLRGMIIGWLNYTDTPDELPADKQARRSLSDILVLVPDLEAQQSLIEAIFPKGVGADGYVLPAKVTGVVAKDINQLWQAIVNFYQLINRAGSRFGRSEVFDWLMLPPLYQSYGLSLEQMSRACELLTAAGFVRGLDEAHLQLSLHAQDDDYRYSFAFALERIVAGLLTPKAASVQYGQYTNRHGYSEAIVPLAGVSMADAGIVAVLCDIYQTLDDKRDLHLATATVATWLTEIENLIQQKFGVFAQTNALLAIFAAQNALKRTIEANYKHEMLKDDTPLANAADRPNKRIATEALPLKLNFVLDSIATELTGQQVSAEPAGVITFARLGAVRNLPFKLVAMLNLNLSDFPQREPYNRYNLMQAGLAVRGDRFREDDDLGAFLDALLCAEQACWLFYNGQSTSDEHDHLPASPVQELLGFLQDDVQWQGTAALQPTSDLADNEPPDTKNSPTKNSLSKITQATLNHAQKVDRYLVTKHPALPFDKAYFELPVAQPSKPQKSKSQKSQQTGSIPQRPPSQDFATTLQLAKSQLYPPAPLWHLVYGQLQQRSTHQPNVIELWQPASLQHWLDTWQSRKDGLNRKRKLAVTHTLYESLDKVIRGLQYPARHFIQHQGLHWQGEYRQPEQFEPLLLDSLSRYQLNAQLLRQSLTTSDKGLAETGEGVASPTDLPSTDLPQAETAVAASEMVIFDSLLPAGVNRYQTLQTHQQKMLNDLTQSIVRLQHGFADSSTPITSQLSRVKKRLQQHFGTLPFDDDRITNAERLQKIAEFITPCQEQRLAIDVVRLDADALPTEAIIRYVLNADLPVMPSVADSQAAKPSKQPDSWVQYLATKAKPHHLLRFWLSHLCWQVVRQTTPAHVRAEQGWSLWQFGQNQTYYLPPIAWRTAYQFLQDWLMVWQLAKQIVMILPPAIVVEYLNALAKDPNSPPKTWLKNWQSPPYNQDPSEDNSHHATWQRLLAAQKPHVIIPFLQVFAEVLYQPLQQHLLDLDNQIKD